MPNLKTLQGYAEQCRDKLGVEDAVALRWSGGECRVKGWIHAHCHQHDGGAYPRGTICLNRTWFATATVQQWHHCVAHEVTHLAVKSRHGTPTFNRRLVSLGVANEDERRSARSTRHHRHQWSSGGYAVEGKWHAESWCTICRKWKSQIQK